MLTDSQVFAAPSGESVLTALFVALVAAVIALIVASYREEQLATVTEERDEAKGDAKYWLEYVCWLEGRAAHPVSTRWTPEAAAQFVHHLKYGFPDELPSEIGTVSNPILCKNGDSARFATVEELTGEKS